ncbi:sigma factor-like helix-turn-helix DNA-binding protein [uncultured Corynebacterium sp.]|uniref:sigma factor-like helix-turn-helix DNA-binding protein n=1 Tax=uncultured Corynebacterium sp. TaxID=159447 RepID=UPI0025D24740|nr:sigma factor-like helix-turn-helix DNA-binding protein [uncultured Corynebacterium sp.]
MNDNANLSDETHVDQLGRASSRLGDTFYGEDDSSDTSALLFSPDTETCGTQEQDDQPSDESHTALDILSYLSAMEESLRAVIDRYGDAPAYINEAVDNASSLSTTTSHSWAIGIPPAERAARLLETIFAQFSDREQEILYRRYGAGHEETLERIGHAVGVTRERIRQILLALDSTINASISCGPVVNLLAAMRYHAYPVGTVEELSQKYPELGRTLAGWEAPLWKILDVLDNRFAVEQGWVCFPSFEDCQKKTTELLDEKADRYGVVSFQDIQRVSHVPEDDLVKWIEGCGAAVIGDHVVANPTTAVSRIQAALDITGHPLSLDEIAHIWGIGQARSLANAAYSEDSIIRISKTKYALREWGLEEFISIRDFIGSRVGDESADLDDLISEGTTKFGVSASSIRSYASSGEFRLDDGIVSRRNDDIEPTRQPEDCRGLYWRNGRWQYLVTVNHDHMRGSGTGVPAGVALLLGLHLGQPRHIASDDGDQSVTWNATGTTTGSIRRLLLAQGITEGERVWMDFGNGTYFRIESAPPRAPFLLEDDVSAEREEPGDTPNPLHAGGVGLGPESRSITMVNLANYMGISHDEIAQRIDDLGGETGNTIDKACESLVAQYLGLSRDAPRRRIVARLRHRHDKDAIAMVEELWL